MSETLTATAPPPLAEAIGVTAPAQAEANQAPNYVTVAMHDGSLDPAWEFVRDDGPKGVVVTKRNPGGITTTSQIPKEEFRMLNPQVVLSDDAETAEPALQNGVPPTAEPKTQEVKPNDSSDQSPHKPLPLSRSEIPGAKYMAETTADATEADWDRIYNEAQKYFELFKGANEVDQETVIDRIVSLRNKLAQKAHETRVAIDAGVTSLGYNGNAELAQDSVDFTNQAVNEAVMAEVPDLVSKSVPTNDQSRKGLKTAEQTRQRLSEVITMQQADFDSLVEDWKLYLRDKKHAEALADQKNVKAKDKRHEASTDIAQLRQKYGESIDLIASLPLSKESGGVTDQTIKTYKEGLKTIGSADSPVAKGLRNINAANAVSKLQSHLSEKYLAEGLDEAEIQRRLEESKVLLMRWLAGSGPEDDLLADLQKFNNAKNKEQVWNAQRQKVREFISTTIFARGFRPVTQAEKAPPAPPINITEAFEKGVDHNGSRPKAGAEALQSPDKTNSYSDRVVLQLEMARDLGRHEGLMKIPIYLTAVDNILTDGAMSAWESIPPEKKKQARKKMMLSMAITSRSIKRLYVKARAKSAKKTGQKQPPASPGEGGQHYG